MKVVELKKWNKLQCDILKECNVDVRDVLEVYKLCSYISHLKDSSDYEKTFILAREIVEKEMNIGGIEIKDMNNGFSSENRVY